MYNYVVTAHKPTSVTTSITGNFTSPNEINLIISKTTRLEIHTLTPDGLEPFLDVGIYGRIASIFLFRPKVEKTDLLFLLTEKNTFSILGYDTVNKQIVTKSSGDLRDKFYRPIPVITSIDPDNRVIGLLLYTGYLKVIPIDPEKGTLQTPFNIRIDETNITSLKFLSNCETPTFAILYRDPKENRNLIKTYKFEKDILNEGPWRRKNIDPFTHLVIPVPSPYNGVLIVSDTSIQYFNHDTNANINIKLEKVSTLLTFGKIDVDGSRYLLGDNRGGLYGLVLERDDSLVIGLKLKKLGVTSIPSSITYLDNGVVYIGSYCGDSQLVKLSEQKGANESFIELLDTFINLGPIVDFCLVDIEKQGQTQIVTCSGCYNDGSLRIIRNGVGVNQQAVLDLPGVKGIWSIKSKDLNYDDYLVVSFVGQTRFFSIVGEEIEDVTIPGVTFQSKTLFCANISNGNVLQITEKSIKLVDKNNFEVLSEWKPENEEDLIHLADVNEFQQILISVGKSDLIYLEISNENQIQITNKIEMEHEVSCLNIHSLSENEKGKVCAIGLWSDNSVRLLTLPKLEEIRKEVISSNELPRSILLITLESISYLLCGLGDGQLVIYTLDTGDYSVSYNQKLSIGSQPVQFNIIKSQNINNNVNTKSIFVSSDKPTLFYSYNKRLICSSLNLSDMNYVTPLHTSSFQNCLAIYSTDSILIGTIDEIQKLHLTTIPLNAMPRRICYQESTHSYAVVVMNHEFSSIINEEIEVYSIRLIDADTFETLSTYKLSDGEIASQIVNFKVGGLIKNIKKSLVESNSNINDEYFIVGVASSLSESAEVKEGKLLVFQSQESKLVLLSETRIHGAPFAISQFNDKILAGINTFVRLFQLNFGVKDNENTINNNNNNNNNNEIGDIMITESTEKTLSLQEVANRRDFIIALKIATRGNSFIVGDVMRSISLLYYNDLENKLEEIARDYLPKWITAIEFIDDENFIEADHYYNLFTLQRQISADCDESRTRLETVGKFHIGDQINVLKSGSIVRKTTESDAIPTILYGTMMGSLGVIASITKEDFDLFEKVQAQINNVIKGVGGLTHEDWRAPFDEKRSFQKSMGFIDGDLIESFLELNWEKKEEVVKKLNQISVEDLSKKIESLSHLLH